ncbi:TetR/AcrR family transcriptional regulator [Thalassospira marina]|uniref:TetR family transcriptional regulator n=1 Tax=Thalassospira marina TaxID=2048283 RepID=A0ABM6Q6D9_9PROT|nr:TetR/AcrR family transcriptional regulator [Thalassospira marina]AUG52087.1 TetR family transcriptional regulator [Thalassospira marina]
MARTGRPREFDRQAALEMALVLFWQQGFEPTSLNQLKEVMGGISPTSFYAAFGSKEQLFREVVALYRSQQGQVTDVLFDENIPPRQAIEQCLRQSVHMQTDKTHPLGCLVTMGATNCGPTGDAVVQLLRDERLKNFGGIKRQLERAVTSGALPSNADIPALAATINTFLNGISLAARDGVGEDDLQASVGNIMRLWDAA